MKKILIVEDDFSIAELQKDYLELSGFQVEICKDGEEGLNAFRKNKYDLLIIDVMLPKINGFEILKEIYENKDIPILLVSAKKEEIDKINRRKRERKGSRTWLCGLECVEWPVTEV